MAGRKDIKSNKSKGGGKDKALRPQDAALWKSATGDVKRMKGKAYLEPGDEEDLKSVTRTALELAREIPLSVPKKEISKPKGGGLDRATDEKLRRGQMKIEGRLDLHGLNQLEAQAALTDFIIGSYARGRRCVLLITGKGGRSVEPGGVLKRKVPEWLRLPPLGDLVLQTHGAKPQHGGAGALYVLLRRNKN